MLRAATENNDVQRYVGYVREIQVFRAETRDRELHASLSLSLSLSLSSSARILLSRRRAAEMQSASRETNARDSRFASEIYARGCWSGSVLTGVLTFRPSACYDKLNDHTWIRQGQKSQSIDVSLL